MLRPFPVDIIHSHENGKCPSAQYCGGNRGKPRVHPQPLSEKRVEKALMWLIQVGLLRREVDGQGITDSFRLTPLGRQIVAKWNQLGGRFPQPSWWERLLNQLIRWFSLPF